MLITSNVSPKELFYNLENLRSSITKNINIKLQYTTGTDDILNQLSDLSQQFAGNYNVVLHLISKLGKSQKILLPKLKLNCGNQTLIEIRKIFGSKNVWLTTR